MKKRKLFAVTALILTVALCLLNGCSTANPNGPSQETTSNTDTDQPSETTEKSTADTTAAPDRTDPYAEAQARIDGLRNDNFGGTSMVIAYIGGGDEPAPERENGVLNVAKIKRNRMVEDKYNVHLSERQIENRTALFDQLKANAASGDYLTDLILAPIADIGLLQSQGYIMNLYSLPFTDYAASYYDRDAMAQLTAGYAVYGAIGDYTDNVWQTMVCFFNKTLCKQYDLPDLYAFADSGEWTWEKMLTLSEYLPDYVTLCGSASDKTTLAEQIFLTDGNHFAETGENQLPQLSYAGDRIHTMISLLRTLYGEGLFYESDRLSPKDAFLGSGLLFYIAPVSSMSFISDMRDAWGVLAMPQIDVQRQNYTAVGDDAVAVCVPKVGIDTAQVGMLLQALFAASGDTVKDAILSDYTNKYLTDNQAILSLKKVIDTPVRYDFVQSFSSAYPIVEKATGTLVRRAVNGTVTIDETYGSLLNEFQAKMKDAFPMEYGA